MRYGMQVDWTTVEAIARTKAIDLWVLFPLGIGVNRLLTKSGDIPDSLWDAKVYYDSARPVTAIRHLFGGRPVRAWAGPYQGTQLIDGSTWTSYVATPPFAEFVSGHSAFSAASAEILRRFTGSDEFGARVTIAAGSSPVEPGLVPGEEVTLSWQTFSDAADEAGLSRRYGGIHFEAGDIEGRALGRRIAGTVWEKAVAYFNGGRTGTAPAHLAWAEAPVSG
jgi:hypothetical protein